MTPAGIEPVTFRFVAQHSYRGPHVLKCKVKEEYESPGVTLFIKLCLLSITICFHRKRVRIMRFHNVC